MTLYIWRHPKPMATEGICIGQTDVAVDKRKLKRLANRIERFTRLQQLPKVIWVSPLQRSLKVGQILARRGFQCRVAPELAEINFGEWDGRSWAQIAKQEIDDWCDDFAHFAPDHGESLQQLFDRVEMWLAKRLAEQDNLPILAVGHAGWINAAKMIAAGQNIPKVAADWPSAVTYGACSCLEI
ncbi:histidine phosphatase family protein [Psychrobacter sp. F1192]|uniref:Histidine phosphatase family protein n=1 Tax=Psychrobacter coccoides TaxID=2818440 RepID=A0ABS3NQ86_9GAMM|nr:histidine phosphatase family protein [Psychrobacter coccoides]MBO1531566.1 histidine phosphatase family protein [Psychrobacter coccoides]